MTSIDAFAAMAFRAWNLLTCLLLITVLTPRASAQEAEPLLNPGHWVEIKDSRLQDVAPSTSPGGDPSKVIGAWSGAALDTKRDRLLVWGGGHSNYAGNEVYAFDLREFRWLRLSDPSVANDSKAAVYPDGQPRSRHTYNYIEYVPAWDRLVSFGGSGPWPRGGGEFTREISEFDFERGRWLTGERTPVPPGGTMIAAIARLDPVTGDIFFVPGARGAMLRFDPITEKWQGGWEPARLTAHATGAIDPDRRLFVAVGLGNKAGTRQALAWNLEKAGKPTDLTHLTSGDTSVESTIAPGFVYHPPSGRFVAWIGGTDLYVLDPDTWHWDKVPAAQDNDTNPGPQALRGTYGRFQYVPRLDAFVLVNGIDQNVFLIKPDLNALKGASGPRAARPAVDLNAGRPDPDATDSLTLSWSAYGADYCEASGGWSGARRPFGSEVVTEAQPGSSYSLTCSGDSGSAEATATAPDADLARVSIAAEPRAVHAGEATTIRWQAIGAGVCNAGDAWHGPRASSGSETTQRLIEDSVFELRCDDSGTPLVAKVYVRVVPAKPVEVGATQDPDAAATGGLGAIDFVSHAMLVMLGGLVAMRSEQLREVPSAI